METKGIVDKEALNKKLAEWAGFEEAKDREDGHLYTIGWEYPDDSKLGKLPNFTESLDDCFKWLVPKLQNKGQVIELIAYEHKRFGFVVTSVLENKTLVVIRNDNPALALCLAIEKLIDGGVE